MSICKECISTYDKKRFEDPRTKEKYKEYYEKNKDKIRDYIRNYHLNRNYDVNQEIYDKLYSLYEGKCCICMNQFDSLHIDYDHKTGNIRGLLCMNCNGGLGNFKDNINYLRQAIIYLEETTQRL